MLGAFIGTWRGRQVTEQREETPLRVLFVDHSSVLGGGQLGLLRYFERRSSLDRRLLVFGEGEMATRARHLGVRVTVLPQLTGNISKLTAAYRLRATLEEAAPDVVVANSLTAANLVALAPPRHSHLVAYLREDLSVDSVAPGLKRTVMTQILLKRFDGFISNSQYTASTIPQVLVKKPVEVAYPVSGITEGNSHPVSGWPFTVASLSRLASWKGIHVLVEAAGRLSERGRAKDFRFIVAGDSAHADPSYGVELQKRAREVGANIAFVGRVEDPLSVIDEAHALALCSTRPEPFGQVIPQALLRRRVVVGTAGGGPAEILGPTVAGVLVPANDPDALADSLEFLADNPEDRISLAERGWRRALDFVDAETAPALDRAIERLASA